MKKASESKSKFLPPGYRRVGERFAAALYATSVFRKLPNGGRGYSISDLERVVELATNGDRAAHTAAKQIAADFIREQVDMPALLERYVVKELMSTKERPRSRGQNPYDNQARDFCITYAVMQLMVNEAKRGRVRKFSRSRATADKGGAHSACSAVAMALTTLGVHISESQVDKIVRQHLHMLGKPAPAIRPRNKTIQ